MAGKTPSLFWRLTTAISLGLLLGAGILAYAAYNYAHTAADDAYDRLLLGAASQIGETIRVEDQAITTDIPVSAFETLSVSRQERVYYRVVGLVRERNLPEHRLTRHRLVDELVGFFDDDDQPVGGAARPSGDMRPSQGQN